MKYHNSNRMGRKTFLYRSVSGFTGMCAAGLSAPSFIRRAHAAQNIKYRTIGPSGIRVTAIGFGGSRTNEPSVMKRVFDMGVNFVDTGRMYAGGRNEEMIGKVIKDFRKNIVIQS